MHLSQEDFPEDTDIQTILVGTEMHIEQREGETSWYRFTVENEEVYVLTVNSEDGDPTMALYGPDEFEYLGEDDDGGGDLNSRIRRTLKPGTYYVAVRDIRGGYFKYSVRIARRSTVDHKGQAQGDKGVEEPIGERGE